MLNVGKNAHKVGTRYLKDQQGGFTILWGLTMFTLVFLAGSALDVSLAYKLKLQAQAVADNMALTASKAVDMDNPDRYVENTPYSYVDIGGAYSVFTNTLAGSVEYDIADGDDKLIARATVVGNYSTIFMSMIGISDIEIKAVSDVAYTEDEGTPASIFFVADNSGSMGNHDGTGLTKIDGLQSSMTQFMAILDTLDDDGVNDTFRTALYPFSADPKGYRSFINHNGLIPGNVVSPSWGTVPGNNIYSMNAFYGTDSSGALQDAADAFQFEDAIHLEVNGKEDPLKYLIFMTDGANNTSEECTIGQVWVLNGTAEYWWRWKKGKKKYKYQEPNNPSNWTYVAETYDGTGYYEDQEVCTIDYHFDVRSLQACDQMKADGVFIYTIAYDIDEDQKVHAQEFLQNCSSGDNFFKIADDSYALEAAFELIGASIVTDVIRVKR